MVSCILAVHCFRDYFGGKERAASQVSQVGKWIIWDPKAGNGLQVERYWGMMREYEGLSGMLML